MTHTNRRIFLLQAIAGSSVLAAGAQVHAQAAPMVAESDPQATALAYKADSSKVDKAKYPKHDAAQRCANCQLYQGKAGEKSGLCPLFAGKQVSAEGWCSAYVKKA